MRTRNLVAITVAASVGLGLIVGSVIPVTPDYGVPHATRYDEGPRQVPSKDALTNEDALFAQSLANVVSPAGVPDAIALAHSFCDALDDGGSPRDTLDDFLRPLTTSEDVVRTAHILGSAVPSYCPEFNTPFLDAAHEMHGDERLVTT